MGSQKTMIIEEHRNSPCVGNYPAAHRKATEVSPSVTVEVY
ncbi:MAG: hypothetical protein O8C58_03350 [Candidatus Methanoperedens sp.]|nr:hypothetical protein [Candidatus Methanoperedens sp.]